MTTQSNSLRLADRLARSPYAFPGGYPMFAITSDNGCICARCAHTEREAIGTTTGSDGWNVVALDINYESQRSCDNCGKDIESAYG